MTPPVVRERIIERVSTALPQNHPLQKDLAELKADVAAIPVIPDDVDYRESLQIAVDLLRDWERGLVSGPEIMNQVRYFEWELGLREKK
jgi:hypothetical protein